MTYHEILSSKPTTDERKAYENVLMYDLLSDLNEACKYAGYENGLDDLGIGATELVEGLAEKIDNYRRDELFEAQEALERRKAREDEIRERKAQLDAILDGIIHSLY